MRRVNPSLQPAPRCFFRRVITLFFLSLSFLCIRSQTAHGAGNELALEEKTTRRSTHFGLGATTYSLRIKGVRFSGYGPEVTLFVPLSQRWQFTGTLGQSYSNAGGGKISSLFTKLDIGGLFCVIGCTADFDSLEVREKNQKLVSFIPSKESSLKIGLSSQQYFFNVSSGAVPYSGISTKILYELGLSREYDVGVCGEYARLSNASDTATALNFAVFGIVKL